MTQPTWTGDVQQRIDVVMRQVSSLREWAKTMGMDRTQADDLVAPYAEILETLYTEDLQLARVLDNADFVVGAQGPAIEHGKARISVVVDLLNDTKQQIANVAKALQETVGRTARSIEPNFYGTAPGSIYIGFEVPEPPPELLFGERDPVYQALVDALRTLGVVSRLVTQGATEEELTAAVPDTRVRQAAVQAVHEFAPARNSGVDKVTLSGHALGAPGEVAATLTEETRPRARQLLQRARRSEPATFKGVVQDIRPDDQTIVIRYTDRREFVEDARRLLDHEVVVRDAGELPSSEAAEADDGVEAPNLGL